MRDHDLGSACAVPDACMLRADTVSAKAMIGSKSPLPPTLEAAGPPPPAPTSKTQPSPTAVKLCGRIGTYSRGGSPPNGYCLIVDDSGSWYLSNGGAKGDALPVEIATLHTKDPLQRHVGHALSAYGQGACTSSTEQPAHHHVPPLAEQTLAQLHTSARRHVVGQRP